MPSSPVMVDVPSVAGTSSAFARTLSAYPDVLNLWHGVVACVAVLLVALCLYPRSREWFGGHASVVLQVLAGLAVIAVMYFISLFALHRDSLVVDERYAISASVDTPILVGYSDASQLAAQTYNTVEASSPSYVHMPRSYNRRGGAQFTYSFWLYVGETNPETVAGRCILMRGDTRKYSYTRTLLANREVWDDGARRDRPKVKADALALMASAGQDEASGDAPRFPGMPRQRRGRGRGGDSKTGVAIKCPRIAFGASYDHIDVSLNTMDDMDAKLSVSRRYHDSRGEEGVDSTNKAPFALSLIGGKWALLTFTFEDHTPINDFEDGILVNFFLNDVLYQSAAISGVLRQNTDALHLFPDGPISGTRIGDLVYSNYAWGAPQVLSAYRKGPPKKPMINPDPDAIGEPLYLSEYNKLDVYNM